MATYLLTWNPSRGVPWKALKDGIENIRKNGFSEGHWSFGNRTHADADDRVFLIKQGPELPRGIIASGRIVDEPYVSVHWSDPSADANYVDVRFDVIRDIETETILDREILSQPPFDAVLWDSPASGIEISPGVLPELEQVWQTIIHPSGPPSAGIGSFTDTVFWWVSHNQTFENEITGYIWSPKRNKSNGDRAGSRNQFYDNMRLANPGEIIFSFAQSQIKAVGVIKGRARSQDRPIEFGAVGDQWDNDGWFVPVEWTLLATPFRPKDYIDVIAPLLASKYSPIRADGNGNQSVYLASLSSELGHVLYKIALSFNPYMQDSIAELVESIRDSQELGKLENTPIPATEKLELRKARLGQGLFRMNLERIEKKCRVTGVSDRRVLNASHIKPWRDSTNEERLDGNNGLLLAVHVDRLFDRGLISFTRNGTLLCNDQGILAVMGRWGIDATASVGPFNSRQDEYLAYHRRSSGFED